MIIRPSDTNSFYDIFYNIKIIAIKLIIVYGAKVF